MYHLEELQLLIASQLSNKFKHSDVHESADLETEEGRKSGIMYFYVVGLYFTTVQ